MKYSAITKISILIIMAVLLLVGWLFFSPEATSSRKIQHVLLISMDTTRADIFSCYGFKHNTSPNIDALAAEGILFERAYAPLSLTLPSHCTMLTGTIHPYHGVHDNNGYKLDDSNVTLAEILKDKGFVTGAIVGSIILDSKYRMDQGFDSYDDNFQEERAPVFIPERQAEETKRIACDWFEKNQNENTFLFLHFYDPHRSYDAPEPYKNMFLSQPYPQEGSIDYLQGRYAGEVAYTDNCIKGIIDKLKQLGLYDSTLIILTSDHGEMFYQHKEVTHGYYIYEGNVRIPLLFKVPGLSNPRRIENTVGHVDIVPTVCSLLDIEGSYTFQGVDVSPYLLEDEPEDIKRHIYLESMTPTRYKANSLLGIVNDKYKYIQTTRPELYDIVNDYPESANLVETYPKVSHLLKGRLQNMLEDTITSISKDNKMELDEETLKQLEALGYVGGVVTEEFSFDTSKIDPKDLIDYHVINTRVRQALVKEQFDVAREMCEKMIGMQPDVPEPYFHLAAIANILEDYSESIKQLKKAIEIEPDDVKLHNFLATIYQNQGDHEKAIIQLNNSLKIDPEQFGAYGHLGQVYYQMKNYEQAFIYVQKALSINPQQPTMLNQMAALYNRQEKPDKAIECFNKSLEIRPKQPEVMSELAMALYGQNKVQQALTLWTESLESDPNQPYAANSLAWIKATSKDEKFYNPDQALKFARQACEFTKYQEPGMLDTLGAALAANGQFDKAAETARKALQLAKSTGQNDLVRDLQRHLNLYEMQKALRE
jgi:arylsulfatase A-like enzyme/Flp pilus assembly protein TadD